METIIFLIFALGYLAIALEHNLKIDKLIPALLMMALAWACVALGLNNFETWFDSTTHTLMPNFGSLEYESVGHGHHEPSKRQIFEESLLYHFGKTCEILIFLIGAMTIVEIIDYFNGFSTIKSFIKTNKKKKLLWIVAFLAFVLSAIIDNLTATIVLITILRKLIQDNKTRVWFAGLIIIAANAGGAWSPIGDVTTTMLWIGHKVTPGKLIEFLVIPSLVCMVIPVFIASYLPAFKGTFDKPEETEKNNPFGPTMLYIGLGMIIFVPIFKTVTHLPPYVGMMLSLGVVSLIAEIVSNRQFSLTSVSGKMEHSGHSSPTFKALGKIEMPSILFFLGILMTVAALESLGMVYTFGKDVQEVLNLDFFIVLLGIGSAVIDNVPLVAASMGMFENPVDHPLWHFIAYSAGTGGSMLIIGSAAGVVAMGMEKIDFFWYLKKIAWLALIGFIAGAGAFIILRNILI